MDILKNKILFSFLLFLCLYNLLFPDTTKESMVLGRYNSQNIDQLILNTKTSTDFNNNHHAYIVLGTSLSKDGTLKRETIKRLATCLKAKKQNEKAYIIVSGGRPVNGNTQANEMKKWLIQHCVKEKDIITEQNSSDTIENAIETLKIADKRDFNSLSLITSGDHVRRATLIFEKLDKNKKVNEIIIPKDEVGTKFSYQEKERIKKSMLDLNNMTK